MSTSAESSWRLRDRGTGEHKADGTSQSRIEPSARAHTPAKCTESSTEEANSNTPTRTHLASIRSRRIWGFLGSSPCLSSRDGIPYAPGAIPLIADSGNPGRQSSVFANSSKLPTSRISWQQPPCAKVLGAPGRHFATSHHSKIFLSI